MLNKIDISTGYMFHVAGIRTLIKFKLLVNTINYLLYLVRYIVL